MGQPPLANAPHILTYTGVYYARLRKTRTSEVFCFFRKGITGNTSIIDCTLFVYVRKISRFTPIFLNNPPHFRE